MTADGSHSHTVLPLLSPPPLFADPQLVAKRPTHLACIMATRNRLAAALTQQEMPHLLGRWRRGAREAEKRVT